MIKINRKIEYALLALRHMNQKHPGELTTAKELTEEYKAPFDTFSRVMQLMAQKEILKAEHGAHGGYFITKDLAHITFFELVETLLDSRIEIARCLEHEGECALTSHCTIIPGITYLNNKILELYKTIKLSELVEARRMNQKNVNGPLLNRKTDL